MADQLYKVLDFILNYATDAEIEVILSSIKKRYKDREGKGAMGVKVGSMARETAKQLQDQMGFSMDGIREQVSEMVERIIRQNAPELSDEQVRILLSRWLPEPGGEGAPGVPGGLGGRSGINRPASSAGPGGRGGKNKPAGIGTPHSSSGPGNPGGPGGTGGAGIHSGSGGSWGTDWPDSSTPAHLPAEVVLDMVRQFIEYSTGSMPASQYSSLSETIPHWEKRYWEIFPPEIKQLISLYLKGTIDLESCWMDIRELLEDPGLQPG